MIDICKNIFTSNGGLCSLHCMALVSLWLFRKNLGDLREFFAQMVYKKKISSTPALKRNSRLISGTSGSDQFFVAYLRVSMGLTDRRKPTKNLVDSRKNLKMLTVSRK